MLLVRLGYKCFEKYQKMPFQKINYLLNKFKLFFKNKYNIKLN